MDVNKMLADLRRQRDEVEQVILNLERLEHSLKRRRGRPPAMLPPPKRRGRPRGSKNRFPRATRKSEAPQPERALAAGQSGAPDRTGFEPGGMVGGASPVTA